MHSKQIKYVADSQKGYARKSNKDGVYFSPTANEDVYVLAVFDGVSSARDAKSGVNLAARYIQKNINGYLKKENADLRSLVFDLNKKILKSKYEAPQSTIAIVSVNLREKKAASVTLGDTRIYEVTKQYIKQLSEDDNPIGSSHIITKYLGSVDIRKDDIEERQFDISGKKLLVCTDGFYDVMEENRLKFHSALNLKSLNGIKNRLKKEVSNNNSDDASYLVVSVDNV